MINFSLLGLGVMCSQSMNELLQVKLHIQETNDPLETVGILKTNQVNNWLGLWKEEALTLEWDTVVQSIGYLQEMLENDTSYQELEFGLSRIKDQIESNLNYQYVFRYSKDCLGSLQDWKTDWLGVLTKFPTTSKDIYAGIDLCCLGHSTASVFHMMRVFEKGIWGLANNLDISETPQVWEQLKDQIEAEISTEQAKRKSPKKSRRLQYFCDIAKEMRFMEERWKDYKSRKICHYDASDAKCVMEHTKLFMSLLADNLLRQDFAKAKAKAA